MAWKPYRTETAERRVGKPRCPGCRKKIRGRPCENCNRRVHRDAWGRLWHRRCVAKATNRRPTYRWPWHFRWWPLSWIG